MEAGTPSAEGARIEAPKAPRGWVLGRGLCPLPRNFFLILDHKMALGLG